MVQLECKNVCLGYDGKIVSENLNFCVESGQYLCIVGENGAGKSTLIKALLGLNPPISGEITFPNRRKAAMVGYLPQHTPVQRDFPASVKEIVLSGCLGKGGVGPFYSALQKQTAARQMERLGITQLQNRCYRELSGGQQQRVLLARALCAAQDLLLLDEPVAGLDPKVTREMYEIIAELNRSGVTVIMVSHDIAAAVRYATHILHLSHEPLFYGTKEAYLKTPIGKSFADLGEEADAYGSV